MHEAFEVAPVAERLPLKVLGEVTAIAAYGVSPPPFTFPSTRSD